MGKRKAAAPKKLSTEEAQDNTWSLKDVSTEQEVPEVINETPSEKRERRLIIVDDDVEETTPAFDPAPMNLPAQKKRKSPKKNNNFFTSVIKTHVHNFNACAKKRVCVLGEFAVEPDQVNATDLTTTASLQVLIDRSEEGDYYTYRFTQSDQVAAVMKKSSVDPLWNSILRLLKKNKICIEALPTSTPNLSILLRFYLHSSAFSDTSPYDATEKTDDKDMKVLLQRFLPSAIAQEMQPVENVEFNPHDYHALYDKIKPTGSEPALSQPNFVIPKLRPYQLRAAYCMVARERDRELDLPKQVNPIWTACVSADVSSSIVTDFLAN